MKARLILAATTALIGAVAWLPLTSAALSQVVPSATPPSIEVPAPAYYYWRDYSDRPEIAKWLEPCAEGAGAVCAAFAALPMLFFRLKPRLREARAGEAPPTPRRAFSSVHGDADWLPVSVARERFRGPHPVYGGIVIGEYPNTGVRGFYNSRKLRTWGRGGRMPLLIDDCTQDSGHGMVVSPSGSGKSTEKTIPAMLKWTGSAVVFDPPDQVRPMVTRARLAMGHRVYHIAPNKPGIDVVGIDVVKWIDPTSPSAEEDTNEVLEWICGPLAAKTEGSSGDFSVAGRMILGALLADMIWDPTLPPERKTMRELRARINGSDRDLQAKLEAIAAHSASPLAVDNARSFLDTYMKTFSGAAFHAKAETGWLAVKALADMVSTDDVDPSVIVRERATLFITIPPRTLDAYPAVGRVILGALQAALRRADGNVATERVLFWYEETKTLGLFASLSQMMTYDRKNGATVVTVWQSKADIKAIWKENAGVFEANSSWVSYAGINDFETAEAISKQADRFTALVQNTGDSRSSGGAGPAGSNRNQGMSEAGAALITPSQVRTLRGDAQIVFTRGMAPALLGRAFYYRRPEMDKLVDKDRFYKGDKGA